MNNEDINNLEEIINLCKGEINNNDKNITATLDLEDLKSLENLLTRYKQLEEENKNCKKEYHSLINKIENKIDKFDYEFEKAKRKNDKDRADYYWDLIGNFIKLLREE